MSIMRSSGWRLVIVGMSLAALGGCKDTKIEIPGLEKAAEKAKEAVTNTVETAKQSADVAGKFELDLNGPMATNGCYGRVHAFSSKRPAILQIASYNDPNNESFPSVLVQAQLTDASLAALAGKTLNAQIYLQAAPGGPVWHSSADRPVEVQIKSAANSQIEGSIVQGALINADTGAEGQLKGTFSGSLK